VFWLTLFFVLLSAFLVAIWHSSTLIDNRGKISLSWLGFIVFLLFLAYVIYFLYLHHIYYKLEKDVQLYVDYERKELKYVKNEKLIKSFHFDDISLIEVCGTEYFRGVYFHNFNFHLKDDEFITVSSLIISDIHKIFPRKKFPNIPIERIWTYNLIPHEQYPI